jgi:hypothetical protein
LKTIEGVSWLGCGTGCWAGLVFDKMGCGQVSASLYFFPLILFSLLLVFCFEFYLYLLFCFAGFELAIHLQDFGFGITYQI